MKAEPLTYQITRLKPEQVAASPAIGVEELASGESPEERFQRLSPGESVPAGEQLVLLWRGDPLGSPDTLTVTSATLSGRRIDVHIETRRFIGPLHANVVNVPVVEIDLGELHPGQYKASFDLTALTFTGYDHPEKAGNPSNQHASFSFVVV